jgi:hypothetical protein
MYQMWYLTQLAIPRAGSIIHFGNEGEGDPEESDGNGESDEEQGWDGLLRMRSLLGPWTQMPINYITWHTQNFCFLIKAMAWARPSQDQAMIGGFSLA